MLLESRCECGIETPGSISHGVSYVVQLVEKNRLGRPMRRYEDNIRMDPKEIGVNTRN